MWELLFVITMSDLSITKEYWPDYFSSVEQCQDAGWVRAGELADQIKAKYPDIAGFDIECRQRKHVEV